jgi:hypothetical protein
MGRLGEAKQPCRADRVYGSGGWRIVNPRYGRLLSGLPGLTEEEMGVLEANPV